MYVDDVKKKICQTQNGIGDPNTNRIFIQNIEMEFGIERCSTLISRKC